MTTNPTSLTAEYIAEQYIDEEEYNIAPFINMVEAYAAQQNAELVAEANKDNVLIAQLHEEVADLQDENERLKQQVIILRDAIAKRLSQADDEGFCLLKAYNDTQPPKEGE